MNRRWRLSRRRLIGGAAATACVGCVPRSKDDAGDDAAVAGQGAGTAAAPSSTESPLRSVMPGMVLLGPVEEVLASVADGPAYVPEMRGYLVRVGDDRRDAIAAAVDPMLHDGLAIGVLALYQKCPHLGCRVPVCDTSGWFECPCHGSRYTPFGEHRDGPGPRGMDAFALLIEDGRVVADTGRLAPGLPVGSAVVDVDALGPHCVEPVAEH